MQYIHVCIRSFHLDSLRSNEVLTGAAMPCLPTHQHSFLSSVSTLYTHTTFTSTWQTHTQIKITSLEFPKHSMPWFSNSFQLHCHEATVSDASNECLLREIIFCLVKIKTHLRATVSQQRLSNLATTASCPQEWNWCPLKLEKTPSCSISTCHSNTTSKWKYFALKELN